MKLLGNLVWILFGGLELAILWALAGFILMITIVGIPFGLQCFKIASLSLYPFGKEIDYSKAGFSSTLGNVIWFIFFGIFLFLANLFVGLMFCITIIGIPFGLQCFKLARLSLLPFGAQIIEG